MREDVWLTVSEAMKALGDHPSVVKVYRSEGFLVGQNEFGVGVIRVRIFNGAEHDLAKKDHVLDWRVKS